MSTTNPPLETFRQIVIAELKRTLAAIESGEWVDETPPATRCPSCQDTLSTPEQKWTMAVGTVRHSLSLSVTGRLGSDWWCYSPVVWQFLLGESAKECECETDTETVDQENDDATDYDA